MDFIKRSKKYLHSWTDTQCRAVFFLYSQWRPKCFSMSILKGQLIFLSIVLQSLQYSISISFQLIPNKNSSTKSIQFCDSFLCCSYRSMNGWGWKGPLEAVSSNLPVQAGPPRAAARPYTGLQIQGWFNTAPIYFAKCT